MRSFLTAGLLLSQAAWAADWQALSPGDSCVITSEFVIADGGRPAPTFELAAMPQPRLIAARIWQPADSCPGSALRFWNYWGSSQEAARTALVARVRSLGGDGTLAGQAADAVFEAPMAGHAGTPRRSPNGAAVLIPGDAADNAPLAEFLASRGYLVVTIPYQGSFIPGYTADLADLESQTQDLQRIMAELSTRELADTTRVALVCHAISATACAMLAMRDARIAAMVSWEGGLPSSFEQDLLRRAPYFEVAALRVPMLVLHAPHAGIDVAELDPYRFASQLRVELPHTSEHHLLVFGLLEDVAPGLLNRDVRRAGDALRAAAGVLQRFLRAELYHDVAERRALATPPAAEAGVIGEWRYLAGLDARVATADLQRRLQADGVAGLRDYCRAIDCPRVADSVTFRRVAAWLPYASEELSAQTLEFAKLRAETFPQSARAHASLALLAHDSGDQPLFERESARAIELLPLDPELDAATRERIRDQLERRRRP